MMDIGVVLVLAGMLWWLCHLHHQVMVLKSRELEREAELKTKAKHRRKLLT
jgi:hypothetical protein